MKKIMPFALFTILILFALQSCKQKESTNEKEIKTITEASLEITTTPGFVHAVYFWLNKDNPELLDEFINVGLPALAQVPSIQSVSWGPPAGTPRDVVDNSYDLAWIVNFASAEDQDEYQVDSLHLLFVEKYKSLFDKVQVYDNIAAHYQAK